MSDQEIRNFLETIDSSDDAVYSKYESEVASNYNGCSDSRYSEAFSKKIWDSLDFVYKTAGSYEVINTFCFNNMGVKILNHAPKERTFVKALSNDKYCYVASKAILQSLNFYWKPKVRFGCIADYYFVPGNFRKNYYEIGIVSFEEDNPYYRAIDKSAVAKELTYFHYCLVRATEYCKNVVAIVPKEKIGLFDVKLSARFNPLVKIAEDANYVAMLLKLYAHPVI